MGTKKSIIPSSGDFQANPNWKDVFVLPQGASGSISSAGWTIGNEGFIQQTFLGGSIRNFNITAGFGDTSSTLSVDIVNDEYNKSDGTALGWGDDVYHNGKKDAFSPPPVGTPVFFKFGKHFATIESAWRKTFDTIYNEKTVQPINSGITKVNEFPELTGCDKVDIASSDLQKNIYSVVDQNDICGHAETGNKYARGQNHFVFGGILQSFTQNRGLDANPVYSVQVVDPREILSNTTVILNNYTGSVYNNKNYFNVYGFLEYDVSDSLRGEFDNLSIGGYGTGIIESTETWVSDIPKRWPLPGNRLQKLVNNITGQVSYVGDDMYRFPTLSTFVNNQYPTFFPITGEGYSRRSNQGIPWYRVRQALTALFNYNGTLPLEYVNAGFGGFINFRGFNYVVDFSGIPIEKIPKMYFLDFDQIDLLSLCQELCDVISHDLFVTLLPVIDHPSCSILYGYNQFKISENKPDQVISGIIRVNAIDRTQAPAPGSIKQYIESLNSKGIQVENQDLGYELSNVTTDKIVAGAQEVEMYYFNNNKDRDHLELRKFKNGQNNFYEQLLGNQWSMETSLKQQILPFYGFLGKNAVTIPRGFGSYQQIMLDTTGLEAYGVGNYYIATELELRAALVSYERWSQFLAQYNELYIEELTENATFYENLASTTPQGTPAATSPIFGELFLPNREFGVGVPRCVFMSDRNYMGPDGYPASPCCPPYGYPLYYKRAEKIGIPEAGLVKLSGALVECTSNLENIKKKKDEFITQKTNIINMMRKIIPGNPENDRQIALYQSNLEKLNKKISQSNTAFAGLQEVLAANGKAFRITDALKAKGIQNAQKVYAFIKDVADKHLGKTFLIKIPKQCNKNYRQNINIYQSQGINVNNIEYGPYGFQPRPISSSYNINNFLPIGVDVSLSAFEHYLDNNHPNKYTYGALKVNFNPISDKWEFNYKPEPQGGFFNFSLYDRNLSFTQAADMVSTKLPFAQSQLLAPQDLSNFVENNGRIQCYVRYDHSECLDLSALGSENFSQQAITSNGFIPDILQELENASQDHMQKFDPDRFSNRIPSIAFVKCQINDEFYMAPKTGLVQTKVFGRTTKWVPNMKSPKLLEVKDPQTGCVKLVNSQPYCLPIFTVGPNGGTDGTVVPIFEYKKYYSSDLDGELIDTEKENLDPENVYAIITLPGVIKPTIDQRHVDGISQAMGASNIKHILTLDVVKGAPGFDQPAPLVFTSNTGIDCDLFSFKQLTGAQAAQLEAMRNIGFAIPENQPGFFAPSPIHPNLVVLPLMSTERCYGPWFSSSVVNGADDRTRYSNIGGKVEFVKDENLAPWNYAGYQLMNEAGALQAQFSNSLLLFSERGGFVIPDAPNNLAIGAALNDAGPLITSVSVDVGDSVKTTVRMDLYTSRFGKLQKQKEEAISRIVRERQKIIDQNNSMIRKGMGKAASSSEVFGSIKGIAKTMQSIGKASTDFYTSLQRSQTVQDKIVATVIKTTTQGVSSDNTEVSNDDYYNTCSIQSKGYLEEAMGLIQDENDLNATYSRSAGDSLSSFFIPYDESPITDSDIADNIQGYMARTPYVNNDGIFEQIEE